VRAFLAANAEPFRTVKAAEIIEAFGGLVPQVDKDVLAEGYAEVLAASMRRALQPGFAGWVDDEHGALRARPVAGVGDPWRHVAARGWSRSPVARHRIPQ